MSVSDAVCAHFRDLGSYDYRPPQQAAESAIGGGGLIDVEILGHIFEQSISDLEKPRNELDGLAEPAGAEKHKTRSKKEGAFYTPAFINGPFGVVSRLARGMTSSALGNRPSLIAKRIVQGPTRKATHLSVPSISTG